MGKINNVNSLFAGLFLVNITGEKTCDLMLGTTPLDYEKEKEYVLKLQLHSLADYVNQNKSVTMVIKNFGSQ